ncbi:MAG TPA: hypothetical protein VGM92_13170, partial [Candidatus Kapabacteria bacterium]
SERQSTPIVVDGDASDWPRPLEYYDKETKLSFSISNDSTKLYFCLQAYDLDLQKKICRAGLQLWIDPTGGKEKNIGLLYPVPSTLQHFAMERSGSYGAPNSSETTSEEYDPIGALRRNFFRSQPGEIQLTGFVPPAQGIIPSKNSFGIEVRINWDTLNNALNYEAAIPFATFYHALTPHDTATPIELTFTVNGILRSESGAKRAFETDDVSDNPAGYPGSVDGGYPGGTGAPGGMGAMGGGGMGGHGGGRHGSHSGGSSADNTLNESQSLTIKLRLAKIN